MSDMVRACMRKLFNAPEELPTECDYETEKRVAYHEAGHTLIAELLAPGSVNFVSLDACSRNKQGLTVMDTPKGYFSSKRHMENRVVAILGGKAASEIVFGEVDTGVNSDLHRAFDIVERFVDDYCSYGFDKWEQCRDSSNELYARRDNQIASDMQRYYEQAKNILHTNRGMLDKLAEALLNRKTLLGSEVRKLINEDSITVVV